MRIACWVVAAAALAASTAWAADKAMKANDLANVVKGLASASDAQRAQAFAKLKGKAAELTAPVEMLKRDEKAGTVAVTLHYVSADVREFGQRGSTEKGPVLEFWVTATLEAGPAGAIKEGAETTLAGKIASFSSTSRHSEVSSFRVDLASPAVK